MKLKMFSSYFLSTQLELKILCSHLRSDSMLQREERQGLEMHSVLYGAIEPE